MKLKCKCGIESKEFENTSRIMEIMERSGFGYVWDIHEGLTAIWMCMNCREIITKAWNTIVSITGTEFVQIPRIRKEK